MISFVPEELAWVFVREREEAARRAPHSVTARRARSRLPLRSLLARRLVEAGIRLDSTAREVAVKAAANGPC